MNYSFDWISNGSADRNVLPQLQSFLCEATQGTRATATDNLLVQPGNSIDLTRFKHAYLSWVNSLPIQESSANYFNGRSNVAIIAIREGLACNLLLSEIHEAITDYCTRSGLDDFKIDYALEKQFQIHKNSPFRRFFVFPLADRGRDVLALTNDFLELKQYQKNGTKNLHLWKGQFYNYNGLCFEHMPDLDLEASITNYLISRLDTSTLPKKNKINEIITNMSGMLTLSSNLVPPFLKTDPKRDVNNWIVMKNGILDYHKYINSNDTTLLPHTSDLFTLNALPFNFDPTATCPTWIKFLNEALPDPQVQALCQEWMGYNLILPFGQNAQFQKFVILVGDGANGKSVFCLVLRLLLGEENVSAVSLEAFDPKRTFPLAAMIGKLANIAEEIGELDKAAEGVLKELVSGGMVSIERKGIDAFKMIPTARLTFATNNLPRFTDRSNGLWRRLMVVPFKNQVLDPSKQNPNLVNQQWWEDSNELPGIFLWALEGLKRLLRHRKFTEGDSINETKREFQENSNPHRSFLTDTIKEDERGKIASNVLYRIYVDYLRKGGHNSLGSAQFAQEVKRMFPNVKLTQHPQRQETGGRSRNWLGISLTDPEPTIDECFDPPRHARHA